MDVLSALAAGLGEYFILKWMVDNHLPGAQCITRFCDLDLVHIAACTNRLVVVKYLMARQVVQSPQLFNACCAALQQKNGEVAWCLMNILKNSALNDEQRDQLVKLACGVRHRKVTNWSDYEHLRRACLECANLLDAGASLLVFQKCWAKHGMPTSEGTYILWHPFELCLDYWSESCNCVEALRTSDVMLMEHVIASALHKNRVDILEYILEEVFRPALTDEYSSLKKKILPFLSHFLKLVRRLHIAHASATEDMLVRLQNRMATVFGEEKTRTAQCKRIADAKSEFEL